MKVWLSEQLDAIRSYFRLEGTQKWPPALLTIAAVVACLAILIVPKDYCGFVVMTWFVLLFWVIQVRK